MTDNGILSLLGLAKRAGKLAAGDDPVRELAQDGVIRAVFLASDAGAASSRQAAFTAGKEGVPLLTLPVTKAELGGALGRNACALCALSDSGFAAKAAEKLAAADPSFAEAAKALAEKHARIQSRRGIKKQRAPDAAQAQPAPRAAGRPRAADKPSRPRSGAAPQKRRDGGKFQKSRVRSAAGVSRKPADNSQLSADKRPAPRKRRAAAIEQPRKLRR
ncbi:hypothetical protein D7X33_06040 [Butyricicoccus sp. 1XD8-22]|nr:hypothetical protein D7X33_06040 [Butyricicoccus sp. 1XD8-22]